MMAKDAALRKAANSKLLRSLAHDKSFDCANVQIGDTGLFFTGTDKRRTLVAQPGPMPTPA